MMRHFRPDLVRERWRIAGSMVALVVGVLAQLLEPWPLKIVIDAVLAPAVDGTEFATGGWFSTGAILALAAITYILIVALRATASYHQSVGFAMIGNRVISRLRSRLYSHLQALPLAFHNKARHGDLLVRMVGDIKLLRDVAVTAILPLLGSVLVLVGMALVMLWLNWKLALMALAVLPLFALSTVKIGRRIHDAARKQRQREGAVAAKAAEAISSMQVVQALSLESHFEQSFAVSEDRNAADEVKTRKLAARLSRTTDLLIACATASVLWYGAHLTLQGVMTAGSLIVFLTYLKRGLRPLQGFAKYAARLAKATAAGERIVELLDIQPDICDAPDAIDAPTFVGGIGFENVGFHYETDTPVLKQFCAKIEPGKFVAVVGQSGAGKSTLISLMNRLYDPTSGRVTIDGTNVRDWTLDSLRSQMSVVLQDTVLFVGSVWDNISYGAPEVTHEQVVDAAQQAAADAFISRLPQGYDTEIGERGVTLSHGERQRIAIARAIIRDAPILLLDEPTTALDQNNKRLVRNALCELATGRTTLLVTHDLRESADADRILLVDDGKVIEQGTHDELIATDGRYAELYRAQVSVPDGPNSREKAIHAGTH
ncbi:MAG: ABC transporter ATP-binding protein [Aeoliella sp.]